MVGGLAGFQEEADCPLNHLNLTHNLTLPLAAGKNKNNYAYALIMLAFNLMLHTMHRKLHLLEELLVAPTTTYGSLFGHKKCTTCRAPPPPGTWCVSMEEQAVCCCLGESELNSSSLCSILVFVIAQKCCCLKTDRGCSREKVRKRGRRLKKNFTSQYHPYCAAAQKKIK